MTRRHTPKSLQLFCDLFDKEDGAATILALYFTIIFLVVGGLAIDFNKVMSERTQLQVASDTAAHAAIYTRESSSEAEAISKSVLIGNTLLPASVFGAALTTSDVEFGVWNKESQTFYPSQGEKTAVRVSSRMDADRGNSSRNILLRIIGRDTFELERTSVYSTYLPPCFTEGFVAEDVVDIQSNNSFSDGFCVHSNTYVSLNSNNYFEPGSVVSMPNLDDLDIPKSGFQTNAGLNMALRTGKYRLRIINKLPDIIDGLFRGDSEHLPDYIVDPVIDTLSGAKIKPEDFVQNRITEVFCDGSGRLTLEPGTYKAIGIVTACDIKFSQGVILEDVVIATTSPSLRSFNAPSGVQLGSDDNCAEGGGAVLMTLGGFNAAASLQMYGSQILAMKDIEFAAQAGGIQGASMVSNKTISGTSNMNMGFCAGSGQSDILEANYFRMVD